MNERIEELAHECYEAPEFDYKKFAELIVKECKSVLLDMINEGQSDFDTLDLFLTEINEHFGVEE